MKKILFCMIFSLLSTFLFSCSFKNNVLQSQLEQSSPNLEPATVLPPTHSHTEVPLIDSPSSENTNNVLFTTDLNSNTIKEDIIVKEILHDEDSSTVIGYCVEIWESNQLLWSDSAYLLHGGATSYFLCTLNNEDYILQYTPYSQMGHAEYSYKLFNLHGDQETIVTECNVEFDYLDSDSTNIHENFSPVAVASFMDDINFLLKSCTEIVSTLDPLSAENGLLTDSLIWLENYSDTFKWNDKETTIENLTHFVDITQGR